MNTYSMTDYMRELKLTLDNTEELYRQALAVTDLDPQGEQIGDLYTATWATINRNAGENVAPTLYTDHDVYDVREVIASTTAILQREARA